MVGLGKYCTECQRWYPLFMFKKDIREFQLKIALGKVRRCRMCVFKEPEPVVRWRDGRFQIVYRTLKQKIKELFTW